MLSTRGSLLEVDHLALLAELEGEGETDDLIELRGHIGPVLVEEAEGSAAGEDLQSTCVAGGIEELVGRGVAPLFDALGEPLLSWGIGAGEVGFIPGAVEVFFQGPEVEDKVGLASQVAGACGQGRCLVEAIKAPTMHKQDKRRFR